MGVEWKREARRLLNDLENSQAKLVQIAKEFETEKNETLRKVEEISELNKKCETVLGGFRNENQILADVLVPNLTATCQHNLERWRAETAVQVGRQVAMGTDESEK